MYEKQSSLKVFSTFGNEQEIGLNLSDSASMSFLTDICQSGNSIYSDEYSNENIVNRNRLLQGTKLPGIFKSQQLEKYLLIEELFLVVYSLFVSSKHPNMASLVSEILMSAGEIGCCCFRIYMY
jgi:hypothetical protein